MIKAKTKIHKNPRGKTMYLTIPSDMVVDGNFPFSLEGEEVIIEIIEGGLKISKE